MKLQIIAVGRLKSGPERMLCDRYLERFQMLGRSIGITGFRLTELAESSQRRAEDRMTEEARAILAAVPEGGRLVALDERGKTLGSVDFANAVKQWADEGAASLTCVIGGPDGLDATVRARAGLVLCFGALTLPHQLVRVLLAEQLYRAGTILTGHPYHRV